MPVEYEIVHHPLFVPLDHQPAGCPGRAVSPSGQHIIWPVKPEVDATYPDQQRGEERTADKDDGEIIKPCLNDSTVKEKSQYPPAI
jgi:hypothetical protein